MNLLKIATHRDGLTQAEALEAARKRGCRLATNKEIDVVLQDDKLREEYVDCFPCWTGTHLDYDGTDCTVTENGKKTKCSIPKKDGWYEQDKFGLPFGKPSSRGNPKARYLWRWGTHTGLVSRGYYWLGVWVRRYVGADGRPCDGLGVLGIPIGKHKHIWKCKCEVCGMVKS